MWERTAASDYSLSRIWKRIYEIRRTISVNNVNGVAGLPESPSAPVELAFIARWILTALAVRAAYLTGRALVIAIAITRLTLWRQVVAFFICNTAIAAFVAIPYSLAVRLTVLGLRRIFWRLAIGNQAITVEIAFHTSRTLISATAVSTSPVLLTLGPLLGVVAILALPTVLWSARHHIRP